MDEEKKSAVTILDICKHLGLSRNTVSKALNGGHVPDKTMKLVLDAAIELGYKSHNLTATGRQNFKNKKILLLSSRMLVDINFFVMFMRGVGVELQEKNLSLLQYSLSNKSSIDPLPDYIEKFQVSGILCLECFDKATVEKILSHNIPTIFMDFVVDSVHSENNYDIILMESFEIIRAACSKFITEKGCKTFGFVGDYNHCRSFYERFLGMREALFFHNLPYHPNLSIQEDDSFQYGNPKEMLKALKKLPHLPDCFVCANDFIAISLLSVLKKLKQDIPNTVKIISFDNSAESRAVSPQLSTVSVDKVQLGKKAVATLFERISDPTQKKRTIYIESRLIERETT